jgi:uncharacterized protein YuzE
MKTTQYFRYTRQRPDRVMILDEWIERIIGNPLREEIQIETQELNENIYLDLDREGRVVSMTIEHAGQEADMKEFLYQRIPVSLSAA